MCFFSSKISSLVLTSADPQSLKDGWFQRLDDAKKTARERDEIGKQAWMEVEAAVKNITPYRHKNCDF